MLETFHSSPPFPSGRNAGNPIMPANNTSNAGSAGWLFIVPNVSNVTPANPEKKRMRPRHRGNQGFFGGDVTSAHKMEWLAFSSLSLG